MKIVDIKKDLKLLKEYVRLCSLEWGNPKTEYEMNEYIENKVNKILNEDKVISVLGLVDDNNEMIGFISLFKYEDDIDVEYTPWYATIYVKKEYRGKGYSKILNDEILKEAKRLGYNTIYLKTDLVNYYEKFGAKFMHELDNGEKLYYIDLSEEE